MPKQHFHTVVNLLHATGVPVVVTQAVVRGQEPVPVPSCIPQRAYSTDSFLFYKENLWNLATQLTDAKKLVFLDADVIFNDTSWLQRTADLLEDFDVVQPFLSAVWLDRGGKASAIKNCAAYAIKMGRAPQLGRYHPGFAWAMTREAFEVVGGWPDWIVTGNADGAFSFCFHDNKMQRLIDWFADNQDPVVNSWRFKDYRRNILGRGLRVNYLRSSSLVHLWHGDPRNRQYITRKDLFIRNDDLTYPVHYRDDGLIVWDDPKAGNSGPAKYFKEKLDDG